MDGETMMRMVEVVGVIQLSATMAMLGVIWVVQLCVYPRFVDIDPEKFIGAHQRHCAGIGIVVVPLMIAELLSAVVLVWPGNYGSLQWAVLILTLATWGATAFIQAPCHTRLLLGFDAEKCRSLTRGNWIRTGLWTVKGILVFVQACH
ncbi:MAG: hypothetical protein AB8D78_11930 [Akkermansiaceae bacterium]